jgi:hypothetical protein
MNGVANGLYGGDLPNQINTPWIDFSEQSTIVGWSSYTAKQIRYKVVGKMIFVNYYISGTSNSTNTTFTVPYIMSNGMSFTQTTSSGINSGTTVATKVLVTSNSNIIQFANGLGGAFGSGWTASGTKEIVGQFFYEI